MTAFDNIKTNNWPAASNEFEDFLVLKLPLNDNASLTESMPVNAGSQELFPKRTLTNVGVSSVQPRSVVNVKLHTFIYNTPGTLTVNGNTVPRGSDPNGDVTFTVAVNGALSSIAWSYDSSNGPYCYMRGIEVDLGDGNGYQLIQDGAFGVSAYSSLISGTVDSNYPLSNLFGGTIGTGYTNGTRHTNPGTLTLNLSSVFTAKKHYDNNAKFTAATQPGSGNRISVDNFSDLSMGSNESWCFEAWINPTQVSDSTLFGLGNTGFAYRIISGSPYLYIGGTGAILNTGTISTNTWTHVAVSRDGNTLRSYINGTQVGSDTTNTASWDVTSGTGAGVFIGAGNLTNVSPPNYHFDGSIQDLRFYKGVAKYTANFTPPSAILG